MVGVRNDGGNWLDWAPLGLRLVIGFGFMDHGWAKVHSGNVAGFTKLLTVLGVPAPHFMAWVTTLVELIGGLCIFIGAFVAWVSIPLIVVMLTAMFSVHIYNGFSSINTTGVTPQGPTFGPPGVEVNLLYVAGLVAFILAGAGTLSIDRLLAGRRRAQADAERPSEAIRE